MKEREKEDAARTGRNDPCWCGSGKKYKKCHLNREKEKPLAFEDLYNRIRDAANIKECFHPKSSKDTCGKIIGAHTVQRSRVLKAIIGEDNHVLTFHSFHRKPSEKARPAKVGWKEASKITGFCSKHDTTTFSPLENDSFSGTKEQCFLHAYRSLCHELFTKRSAIKALPIYKEFLDRGYPLEEQIRIQNRLDWMGEGLNRGIEDLQRFKGVIDKSLLEKEYDIVRSVVFEFEGPLCIAASGAFTPNIDFHGRNLQTLHDEKTKAEGITISSDVIEGGSVLVFCWLSQQEIPEMFMRSLIEKERDKLGATLPQLLFFHIENTYFSKEWWNRLHKNVKSLIAAQAVMSNPYYSRKTMVDSHVTPWKLKEIRGWN